jgi:hypothetical protein
MHSPKGKCPDSLVIGVRQKAGDSTLTPLELAEGDKIPLPVRHRRLVSQDVDVAVISLEFEMLVFRPTPLIENLLDRIKRAASLGQNDCCPQGG